MPPARRDSLKTRRTLEVGARRYDYFSLAAAEAGGLGDLSRLPYSLKILLENLLRHEDGATVTGEDIRAMAQWLKDRRSEREIAYRPARVLMQDFTGVPAVVDLAAMREATIGRGGDPERVNPLVPVDLVIDHSVMVDHFGTPDSFRQNVEVEFARNRERYEFLRWGQTAFRNFRVVPPGTGICHQVNLEYLAQVVWSAEEGADTLAYPDTVVGTDSHTTMVNGLAVLGWGVGGIEAEAAMLGQPISMVIPEVVGFRLVGAPKEGATATDLVLTVTQILRKKGVVGKFVEFFGSGLDALSLADRATIANMAPEYGATCGLFPIDRETIRYLSFTGRDAGRVALVEAYAKAQGMWRERGVPEPAYTDTIELDLASVEPSLAGPKRPQDRVALSAAARSFETALAEFSGGAGAKAAAAPVKAKAARAKAGKLKAPKAGREVPVAGPKRPQDRVALSAAARSFETALAEFSGGAGAKAAAPVKAKAARAKAGKLKAPKAGREVPVAGESYALADGHVVIASITSCTNTSNPSVLVGAGLLARKARERGLTTKPWVKTSFAPGSQVVTDYMEASGLQRDLDALGFALVAYGCTTCIGNSGPLPEPIAKAVEAGDLVVAAVLSGNRNFEGRIHPLTKANYLASPPLCVAYALAGSMRVDLAKDPLGIGSDGKPVYLQDVWPSNGEIRAVIDRVLSPEMYRKRYGNVFDGGALWRSIASAGGRTYVWQDSSTYVRHPPYFESGAGRTERIADIRGARILALLGDSVTTDHISPAGSIMADSPAGKYLVGNRVTPTDFNSYGARRGNHEVMMRGTFANIRIRNEMVPEVVGGVTRHVPSGEVMPIYDAAMRYREERTPLVIVAGKEYGTGSSRDWAAKGTLLLGVRAVIAESYERIHRSNLVGMGVLPLQFPDGVTRKTLRLEGRESVDILGVEAGLKPRMDVRCRLKRADGGTEELTLVVRVDTLEEVEYLKKGGILHYVLANMLAA